ncbi:MAG: hypothetical protein HY960_02790 [Ignavibacteriae bacterium]|nr:hypothetical protein [Ignavibacteriota bacterium]
MKKVPKYIVLFLLVCYGLTYHVVPVMHTHQISCGHDSHEYKNLMQANASSSDDGLVCLICQRMNSLDSLSFDIVLFQGILTTTSLLFVDTDTGLVSTILLASDGRAPPTLA